MNFSQIDVKTCVLSGAKHYHNSWECYHVTEHFHGMRLFAAKRANECRLIFYQALYKGNQAHAKFVLVH